jgi:very-short-patch-repair endonuclease
VPSRKPPADTRCLDNARHARRHATDAETLLWRHLRRQQLDGLRFRCQHPVGQYLLDFYCHEARLAVELDGGGHAGESQLHHDTERSAQLQAMGIRVVRFWNHDVLSNIDGVVQALRQALEERLGR